MTRTKAAATRLRSQRDFSDVYSQRQAVRNRNLTLCYLDSSTPQPRLGLSVSKRIGNAVQRNRVKRVLREVFRAEIKQLQKPMDVVLIPRAFATGQDVEVMRSSLRHLISKLNRRIEELAC